MGILDKLFGGRGGERASEGLDVESAVGTLAVLYDEPEARADGGLPIQSRQADEVRALGRRLHKAGGKDRMLAVRDALRQRHSWAVANLEAIWASLPEWRGD
jgi:hypothetical protein